MVMFEESGKHRVPLYWLNNLVLANSFNHDLPRETEKKVTEFLEAFYITVLIQVKLILIFQIFKTKTNLYSCRKFSFLMIILLKYYTSFMISPRFGFDHHMENFIYLLLKAIIEGRNRRIHS